YRLMDILACPMCRNFPLTLQVFEEKLIEPPQKIRRCELYCSFHRGYMSQFNETDCKTCYGLEIVEGILKCGNCGRWYPIASEIPRMLPDDLRDKRLDNVFMNKWRERITP
ncbi:MAG: Trm112 family protein, partial [Nitrososphaerota archaeon]